MPKRGRAGPPYTDEPNEVYVVVVYPWGMARTPHSRGQVDFDRIAAWAQLVLRDSGLGGGRLAAIECVYGMGTRDEIIIQFAEGTNVVPLLGEHRWANIAKGWKGPPDDPRSTRVFLYNWRNNGDPSLHNWSEYFPSPPSLDTVPANSPYPPPTWAAPPITLINFVLPIPRPAVRPVPERVDVPEPRQPCTAPLPPEAATTPPASSEQVDNREYRERAEGDSSTGLFRPYEPPSHARFREQGRGNETASLRELPSPSPPKLLMKRDPYEQEEDALSLLRAPDLDVNEESKPIIKMERSEDSSILSAKAVPPASLGYRPNAELEAFINAHLQNTDPVPDRRGPVKREHEEHAATLLAPQTLPPASLGYQPSSDLAASIHAHLRRDKVAIAKSPASGDTRPNHQATVKREYEDDTAVPWAKTKRIKVEED